MEVMRDWRPVAKKVHFQLRGEPTSPLVVVDNLGEEPLLSLVDLPASALAESRQQANAKKNNDEKGYVF